LQRSVCFLKWSCTNNEQNQICRYTVLLQHLFSSFSLGCFLMIASFSKNEVQSFHEVQS
jgi:hypothetical protein